MSSRKSHCVQWAYSEVSAHRIAARVLLPDQWAADRSVKQHCPCTPATLGGHISPWRPHGSREDPLPTSHAMEPRQPSVCLRKEPGGTQSRRDSHRGFPGEVSARVPVACHARSPSPSQDGAKPGALSGQQCRSVAFPAPAPEPRALDLLQPRS